VDRGNEDNTRDVHVDEQYVIPSLTLEAEHEVVSLFILSSFIIILYYFLCIYFIVYFFRVKHSLMMM
jgi:hypothetical protein